MRKSQIIKTAVLVAGIYYVLVFLLQEGTSKALSEKFFNPVGKVYSDVIVVLTFFAIGVGVANIFSVHLHRLIRARQHWEYSIVLMVGFFAVFIFGVLKWLGKERVGDVAGLFDYMTLKIIPHMDATIYSFLAFFVTSAALRAFRIRSMESAAMMFSAVLVLVALATNLGPARTVYDWIDAAVTTSVFRALNFGVLLGGITVALRIWLGIERSALFEEM